MDVRDFTQFERSTENSLKILSKGRSRKVVSFNEDLGDLRIVIFFQNHENFDEMLQNFEIRAAQNCENLVDLEKC